MWNYERVGSDRRPVWWHTVLLVLSALVACLASASYSPPVWGMQHGSSGGMGVLAMFASLGLPFLLCWRHRWPFIITLVAAGVSVVIPIGNGLPLICLATLIGRRRGPAVWWTTVCVGLTSIWVVLADARAEPRGASFLKIVFGPQPSDQAQFAQLGVTEIFAVLVLGMGMAVGTGLLVRSRREAVTATGVAQAAQATTGQLGDELARREERERIAREVHDAMGHRLSLLSLYAGALEANSGDDPKVSESAHLVRQSAGEAMNDLRSLLNLLREPVGTDQPAVPLSDLAKVVQESFGAGQQLSSSIFIQDADSASAPLSRAVYRIVQELLTNARKHAPHEQVLLTVEGNPASGVVIDARNRYVEGGGPSGSSRGLKGIEERTHLLGGTMRYGLDGDQFRVHVTLPWRIS
ncbi:sensor histidine kinase [Propionibacterium sp.]|uniref:sensor histidine kinase n=1 Tax=Propionibacterium sp. TaxID=1977903 RepID=UPI0039E8006A